MFLLRANVFVNSKVIGVTLLENKAVSGGVKKNELIKMK